MKYYTCEICKERVAVHEHHLFSNTKLHRKLYGKLIDDPKNIMHLCEACHLWKPIPKYGELKFCDVMGIKPKSKEGIEIYKRIMEL